MNPSAPEGECPSLAQATHRHSEPDATLGGVPLVDKAIDDSQDKRVVLMLSGPHHRPSSWAVVVHHTFNFPVDKHKRQVDWLRGPVGDADADELTDNRSEVRQGCLIHKLAYWRQHPSRFAWRLQRREDPKSHTGPLPDPGLPDPPPPRLRADQAGEHFPGLLGVGVDGKHCHRARCKLEIGQLRVV
jgi:hypothetical protein